MIQQFTWQQFLIAALILTLVWYLAIVLLYFRRDISRFNPKGNHRRPGNVQREREQEAGTPEAPGEDMLMGRKREPDGVSIVAMDELRFAPRSDDPDAQRDTQLGSVPDVLEELKGIFRILEKEGGTKEDFISLFTLVSTRYPQIKGTPGQQALNEHIRNNVLFPISDEELDQLWE